MSSRYAWKNSTIGPGKMYALGLRSQCLMVYLASHCVTQFVRH